MTADRARAIAAPSKLLLAIFDAHDEWQGEPLHEALVRVLEAQGLAGATVPTGLRAMEHSRRSYQRSDRAAAR
jgi:PII-like signaling protein